jgi:putative DNA primase/helicase
MALCSHDPFLASPPLPHEQLRIAVTARRVALLKLGYEPIPVMSGRKRPPLNDWQDISITIPPDEDVITPWADTYPGALSTGIRTRYTPGFDIDIRDQNIADQVEQALLNMIGSGTILKRVGQPPKRLVPCRSTTPFDKLSVHFKSPDDIVHGIEVLCDGQQFVAEGIHETTQQPYRWADNASLINVAHEHLPLVDEALARRFVAEASEIMRRAGWTQVDAQGKPKKNRVNGKARPETNTKAKPNTTANIYYRSALKDECAALAAMAKDSGRNNALNTAAFNLFQLVAGGGLDENVVRERLFAAAEACGLVDEDGATQVLATIESGAHAGHSRPRAHAQAEPEDAPPILKSARASTFEMSAVQWLWPNRFALGKLGILAGLPDEGKGQVLCDMAAWVTRGLDWPCDEGTAPLGNVVLLTAEDDPKDTVVPRLLAAGADWERVEIVQMVHEAGKDRMFSLVNDLDLLRERVLAVSNVKMIQIDPITAYLGVKQMDSFRTTDVRAVLGPVTDLAGELMVSIVGIMHFNKKTDVTNALLRISDSLAFSATARHVYAVVDDAENKRKLLVKGKNNLAPHDTKALAYGFGAREVGKDKQTGKAIWAPHVIWYPQHVDVTANDAMQAAGGQSGYAKREAREFLLERLEAGPVKADDLLEEAEQNGISKRTLMRMKKDLGIRSRKEQGKIGGTWTWELPPQPRTVADP